MIPQLPPISSFNKRKDREEDPINPKRQALELPPAPISPEKAPRDLIIESPLDNDTLCHAVRRNLFLKKSSWQYAELSQRDRRKAETHPEQKAAYIERADEYNNQWFESLVMRARVKTAIARVLSYDHIK